MFTLMTRLVLGLTAITLLGIGGLIVLAPQVLLGSNGIILEPTPAMMSEIRAPGVLVLLAGTMSLIGTFNRSFTRAGLAAGAAAMLSYGFGRIVSIGMDGLPPEGLIFALAIELGLGVLCALLLMSPRTAGTDVDRAALRLKVS